MLQVSREDFLRATALNNAVMAVNGPLGQAAMVKAGLMYTPKDAILETADMFYEYLMKENNEQK